jgi:RHS repeat-associated protein
MRNEMVSEPQPVNVSGSAVGAASVTLQLDSQPVGVSYDPASSNGVWSASLLAGNGAHTLVATAHASLAGFNPSSTNSFTVISTNTINTSYDQNGNAVQRVFGDGRTQTLTWDGRGRLCAVNEQDSQTNGYTWSATYDAIGRRLRTIYRPITNGVNLAAQTLRVDSWYDPQVRYLEIAVEVNGDRTWKVYGPDVDGVYGGMQGLGGLEATIHESDGQATGVINNDYGDAVGTVTNAAVTWATLAFNGYGPIPGSIVPVLSTNLAVSSATIWRDKRIDPTGFYYFGARYYDPRSGRFLSPDPLGQAASDDLYSYCGGDPVNSFDPDGRCANPVGQMANSPFSPGYQAPYDGPSMYAASAPSSSFNSTFQARDAAGSFLDQMFNNVVLSLATPHDYTIGPLQTTPDALYQAAIANVAQQQFGSPLAQNGVYNPNSSGAVWGTVAGDVLPVAATLYGGTRAIMGDAAVSSVPGQVWRDYESDRLAALNVPKNTTLFQPTSDQVQSAAFQVIVGPPQYTAGGQLVGTISDGTAGGGLLEIKGGSSTLNSSYQLRLQTYNSVVNNVPLTIETTRPVNPTFMNYLQNWGVTVKSPGRP